MSFLRARRGSLLWLLMIGVVALVLAVLAAIPLLKGADAGTEGSLVGRDAPSISANDLAGRGWTLANGTGRLTWVNFWATNCEPCRTEMPAMQRLADAYGDRLLILGLDWGVVGSARASVASAKSRTPASADRRLIGRLRSFRSARGRAPGRRPARCRA